MKTIILSALLCGQGLALPALCASEQDTAHAAVPDNVYPPADLAVPTWSPYTAKHYPERIAQFKRQPLKATDIVFAGDSLTEHGGDWNARLHVAHIVNRGISGDVTDGLLARLGEVAYAKPAAVFVMIGTNDLFRDELTGDHIADNILKIASGIKAGSPATKVFVYTVLPTSRPALRDKIKQTNDRLKGAPNPPFTLIDLHAALADGDDLMRKEYTVDGVHLTEGGYAVWANTVRPLVGN